jgi:hypothetical protein
MPSVSNGYALFVVVAVIVNVPPWIPLAIVKEPWMLPPELKKQVALPDTMRPVRLGVRVQEPELSAHPPPEMRSTTVPGGAGLGPMVNAGGAQTGIIVIGAEVEKTVTISAVDSKMTVIRGLNFRDNMEHASLFGV